ncbi:hypothetical protein [Pseudomonas mucidolens]
MLLLGGRRDWANQDQRG